MSPTANTRRRRTNPADRDAKMLAEFVAKMDGASRSTLETLLSLAKENADDFALPASRRKLWKALQPIIRAELKGFAPRRNPAKKKKAPAKRRRPGKVTGFRYRCGVKCPRRQGLAWREFNAKDDAAALRYANGLMLARMPAGSRPQSLKRIGPAEKKK